MPDRTMTGVYPILSTPFRKDSSIDYEDLERQVEWFIESGVHGMGIAMASEVYKLTGPERDDVLTSVVKTTNGRAKVVMNTGAEGTDATIFQSRRAEELGADALMIRPPTYVPTVASEVVEFFGRVGESVTIPIFLQDQSTAQVPPAMAVQCARRHENLCYIKVESPPTAPRTAEAARLRGDSGPHPLRRRRRRVFPRRASTRIGGYDAREHDAGRLGPPVGPVAGRRGTGGGERVFPPCPADSHVGAGAWAGQHDLQVHPGKARHHETGISLRASPKPRA